MPRTDISSLKQEIAALQSHIRVVSTEVGEEVGDHVERVRQLVLSPLEKVQQIGDDLDPRPAVRRYPLLSLAVAFGGALALSALAVRRRSTESVAQRPRRSRIAESLREALVGSAVAFAATAAQQGMGRFAEVVQTAFQGQRHAHKGKSPIFDDRSSL